MIAALILESLDVPDDVIVADYLLTNDVIEGILRRIQGMQPHASPTTQSLAAQPEALRRFRDILHGEYGGAVTYLQGHGVAPGTLERLRLGLLE